MVDEIIKLNNLDMELYEHAKILFAKEQRHLTAANTISQIQDDRSAVLSMFSALCVTTSMLLLILALVLRAQNRLGYDWVPFWLRRVAIIPVHEKL